MPGLLELEAVLGVEDDVYEDEVVAAAELLVVEDAACEAVAGGEAGVAVSLVELEPPPTQPVAAMAAATHARCLLALNARA